MGGMDRISFVKIWIARALKAWRAGEYKPVDNSRRFSKSLDADGGLVIRIFIFYACVFSYIVTRPGSD